MLVVIVLELLEGLLQFLDCLEGSDPEQIFLERRMKRSAQPFPSGARTRDGEDVAPSQAISFRKSWLMYCEPLSWRIVRPAATSVAHAPKQSRTPWRIGCNASKRVPRVAAWTPTQPAGQ